MPELLFAYLYLKKGCLPYEDTNSRKEIEYQDYC
jgi:hypothetical protein